MVIWSYSRFWRSFYQTNCRFKPCLIFLLVIQLLISLHRSKIVDHLYPCELHFFCILRTYIHILLNLDPDTKFRFTDQRLIEFSKNIDHNSHFDEFTFRGHISTLSLPLWITLLLNTADLFSHFVEFASQIKFWHQIPIHRSKVD